MKCAVGNCKQSNSIKTTVSFYNFPKDKALRKLWVQFCNRVKNVNPNKERLCALHFKQEDFERNLKFEMGFSNRCTPKLKTGAVPSIDPRTIERNIPNKSKIIQCEENGDARTAPDLPEIALENIERNAEVRSESISEIKNEPPDNDAKEENLQKQPTTNVIPDSMGSDQVDVNPVVKEEPMNEEIDYNMPIGKTPLGETETNCDVNELGDATGMADSIDKPNNENSEATTAKKSLDAYLDGLATPLMPRLRVKTEFTLQKNQRQTSTENGCINTMDTCGLPPPPPPTLSSNSNSDIVADGIATPRISLVSTNRLRVKTEFSVPPATPSHNEEDSLQIPDDYFDDLIDIKVPERESGEVSPSVSGDGSDDEPIPQDFFDDLLLDKLKERIQEAQNNEYEEKYSDRLKELERLKNDIEKNEEKSRENRKNRKKQKKSKKKSRKRSRSRSLSPGLKTQDRNSLNHARNKRCRLSPPHSEFPSSSNYTHREGVHENRLRLDTGFKIKSELPVHEANIGQEPSLSIDNVEEIEEVLTPKQKREKAIKRAACLLKYLNDNSDENSSIFSTFSFVPTVRKLPTSHSYVQQQMYENRSPLHTVNNVSYKFNSHTTRFNMEEWGLAALPPNAAKMAKLVGCSAQYIHTKLKTIKIPAKLKKVKQEPTSEAANDKEEELIETTSSLYSNAMTQTDDVSEFDTSRKEKGYEIGIQAEPTVYSIGCQTLETQSPTKNVHNDDEAPIMKIIRDLNENQLMAIHAFAEFIKEPNTSTNAMEMYKIQMKILDIYKMSQIPSALVTTQPPIVNNYTTITTNSRDQPPICIKSVKGADGKQFSVNDPRSKSAAYAKRATDDNVNSSSFHDSRYSSSHAFPPSSSSRSGANEGRYYSNSNSPSARQWPNSSNDNQASNQSNKHYGRGGLRR